MVSESQNAAIHVILHTDVSINGGRWYNRSVPWSTTRVIFVERRCIDGNLDRSFRVGVDLGKAEGCSRVSAT